MEICRLGGQELNLTPVAGVRPWQEKVLTRSLVCCKPSSEDYLPGIKGGERTARKSVALRICVFFLPTFLRRRGSDVYVRTLIEQE